MFLASGLFSGEGNSGCLDSLVGETDFSITLDVPLSLGEFGLSSELLDFGLPRTGAIGFWGPGGDLETSFAGSGGGGLKGGCPRVGLFSVLEAYSRGTI